MKVTVLELSQKGLNDLLMKFLAYAKYKKESGLYPLFYLLYMYGFRVTELKDLHEWQVNGNEVFAATGKNSHDRVIEIGHLDSEIRELILKSIEDGNNYIYVRDYAYIYRFAKDYFDKFNLSVNGRGIATHIFRHHYVKYLEKSNVGKEDVDVIMGFKGRNTARIYGDSVVRIEVNSYI